MSKKIKSILTSSKVDDEAASVIPLSGTPEEEAEDERMWAEEFAANKDKIALLAAQARKERRQGKTIPIENSFSE